MTIKIGDTIPSLDLFVMGEDGGPQAISTDELFKDKVVALFGLPGAFTPTCSANHLPGYVQHADALREKGVDDIICISVNDAFVMGAWGKDQGADDKVDMLAARSAQLGISAEEIERQDFEPDSPRGNAICRMVDAAEVAYLTTYLASDKAWAITGEVIAAGGGTGSAVYY